VAIAPPGRGAVGEADAAETPSAMIDDNRE
jgi:hypothetical protein